MILHWSHKYRGPLLTTLLARWMGLTSCTQHSLLSQHSLYSIPDAQPSFRAFQQKATLVSCLAVIQWFRLSLKLCPSLVGSKSFALLINKCILANEYWQWMQILAVTVGRKPWTSIAISCIWRDIAWVAYHGHVAFAGEMQDLGCDGEEFGWVHSPVCSGLVLSLMSQSHAENFNSRCRWGSALSLVSASQECWQVWQTPGEQHFNTRILELWAGGEAMKGLWNSAFMFLFRVSFLGDFCW